MNQSILFNDDYSYNVEENTWHFTGFCNGMQVNIKVKSIAIEKEFSQSLKFDLEMLVEDWLEENEPDDQGKIYIA